MKYFVALSCLLLAAGAQASLLDFIDTINITDIFGNGNNLLRLELPLTNEEKLDMGYAEDTTLNFIQQANKYGYEAEEFTVTTEDGYILTLFHMWLGTCTNRGTPVLWMHGVMMSADGLLAAGPGRALGYLLADNCYDVWAGNNRGNNYARAHTTLDPDNDAAFWEHSPDEMATYDLPAIIDEVLAQTGYSSLSYIGFSQGAGLIFMMCADQPAQCPKVSLVITMSTATRLTNTRSAAGALLFVGYMVLQPTLASLGIYETQFKGSVLQSALEYSCQQSDNPLLFLLCQSYMNIIDSTNPGSVATETYSLAYSGFPSGVSVRTMARYAQAAGNSRLLKYDFGNETLNMDAYGSTTPPEYDISLMNAPLVMFTGSGDMVMDPRDTLWVAGQVPNLLEVHLVADPNWNHFDNIYSQNIGTYLLPTTLQYLAQYTTYN